MTKGYNGMILHLGMPKMIRSIENGTAILHAVFLDGRLLPLTTMNGCFHVLEEGWSIKDGKLHGNLSGPMYNLPHPTRMKVVKI